MTARRTKTSDVENPRRVLALDLCGRASAAQETSNCVGPRSDLLVQTLHRDELVEPDVNGVHDDDRRRVVHDAFDPGIHRAIVDPTPGASVSKTR